MEITMDEWYNRMIKTCRYKTIHFNYIGKYTLLLDTKTGYKYKATYCIATNMMNLRKVM